MKSITKLFRVSCRSQLGIPLDTEWTARLTPEKFCPHCSHLRDEAKAIVEDPHVVSRPSSRCSMSVNHGWTIIDNRFFDVVNRSELLDGVRIQPVRFGANRRSQTHVALLPLRQHGIFRTDRKRHKVVTRLCSICKRLLSYYAEPYLLRRYWPADKSVAFVDEMLMTSDVTLADRLNDAGLREMELLPCKVIDKPRDGLPASIEELRSDLKRRRRYDRPDHANREINGMFQQWMKKNGL